MVPVCGPLPMDITDVAMGLSDGGSIREPAESSSSTLHVSVPGRAGGSDRCPDSSVAERSSVCISSPMSTAASVDPMPTTEGIPDVTSVTVESTRKVDKPFKHSRHSSSHRRASKQSANLPASLGIRTSKSSKSKPKTMVSPREKLKDDGFSDRVIDSSDS